MRGFFRSGPPHPDHDRHHHRGRGHHRPGPGPPHPVQPPPSPFQPPPVRHVHHYEYHVQQSLPSYNQAEIVTAEPVSIPVAQYVDDVRDVPVISHKSGSNSHAIDEKVQEIKMMLDENALTITQLIDEVTESRQRLVPIMGEAYIKRIESDSIWQQPTSEQFVTNFVLHESPAIADIARKFQSLHFARMDQDYLQIRLDKIRNENVSSDISAKDMHRLMEDQRMEIERLTTRLNQLETTKGTEIKALRAKVKNLEGNK